MDCPHGQVQWVQDPQGNWHRSVAYKIHASPCMPPRARGEGVTTIGSPRRSRGKAGKASLYTHVMHKVDHPDTKWIRRPVKEV